MKIWVFQMLYQLIWKRTHILLSALLKHCMRSWLPCRDAMCFEEGNRIGGAFLEMNSVASVMDKKGIERVWMILALSKEITDCIKQTGTLHCWGWGWGTLAEAGVSTSKLGVVSSKNFASGNAEVFVFYRPIQLIYNKSFCPQALKDRGSKGGDKWQMWYNPCL